MVGVFDTPDGEKLIALQTTCGQRFRYIMEVNAADYIVKQIDKGAPVEP